MMFSLKKKKNSKDPCYMYRVNLHYVKWYICKILYSQELYKMNVMLNGA